MKEKNRCLCLVVVLFEQLSVSCRREENEQTLTMAAAVDARRSVQIEERKREVEERKRDKNDAPSLSVDQK